MLVTVTANPAIDRILQVPRLTPGTVHRASQVTLQAGGKGLNVARAARGLGANVLATGPLAGLAGQQIAALAAAEGLPSDWFWLPDGESRTCLLLVHDGCDATVVNEEGPQGADWGAFARHLEAVCRRARAVAFCGSLPPGLEPEPLARLAGRLAGQGKAVFMDTSGEPLKAVLRRPEGLCIKVNLREFRQAWGPEDTAPDVVRAGAEAVVISLGSEGILLAGREEPFRMRGPAVEVVSTVGSGDCLLAGLAVARLKGRGWREAARLGMACAAANCRTPLPGRFDPDWARAAARQVP